MEPIADGTAMKQQYAYHQQIRQQRQKLRMQRTICCAILALLLLLIWGNSLQPAEASSAISSGVLSKLQPLWLQLTGASFPISHHLLRKLGHFSEFFLLGLVSTLTGTTGRRKLASNLPMILYIGLAVAVADETIQYFSPGRSPEVRDILIDYSGFCCGLLAALVLCKILSAMYQGLSR